MTYDEMLAGFVDDSPEALREYAMMLDEWCHVAEMNGDLDDS